MRRLALLALPVLALAGTGAQAQYWHHGWGGGWHRRWAGPGFYGPPVYAVPPPVYYAPPPRVVERDVYVDRPVYVPVPVPVAEHRRRIAHPVVRRTVHRPKCGCAK